jgi:dTDP-D-glucose 4,6-dehydratase
MDKKFEDLRNYKVSSNKYLETKWKPQHTLNSGIMEIVEVINNHRLKNMEDPIYSNEKIMELFYSRP